MNRFLKVILVIFVIFASTLLFSPFVSLLLPEKITNHTYYRLMYNVIADKETQGCQNDEEKALRLYQYVVDHEFLQGNPPNRKPLELLIFTEAYCDFQARTLNALLAAAGILSRYDMMLDKDGISPHTLNEVFLEGKWCVFDPSVNIIFKDKQSNRVSLEEMSCDLNLIFNNRKILALKEHDPEQCDGIIQWYCRMFPIPAKPRQSTPVILQVHIFDRILDTYFRVFQYSFSNFYQDIYLRLKKRYSGKKDFRLFFMARNYHLAYRYNLALKYYNLLLKKYPQSNYAPDVLFFRGQLFFETKDFIQALNSLKLITKPDLPKLEWWGYYYLGHTYAALGDKQASLEAYLKAGGFKLSAEIIEELNKHELNKRQQDQPIDINIEEKGE